MYVCPRGGVLTGKTGATGFGVVVVGGLTVAVGAETGGRPETDTLGIGVTIPPGVTIGIAGPVGLGAAGAAGTAGLTLGVCHDSDGGGVVVGVGGGGGFEMRSAMRKIGDAAIGAAGFGAGTGPPFFGSSGFFAISIYSKPFLGIRTRIRLSVQIL